jgi:uncharacterized membrane protein
VVIDYIWLAFVAKDFYWDKLGHVLGDVKIFPAAIFYVLFLFGVTFFVTQPNIDESYLKIAVIGALFGILTYATYDLTNQATMKDWPTVVTIVDLVWGMCISASVSVLTILFYRIFFG